MSGMPWVKQGKDNNLAYVVAQPFWSTQSVFVIGNVKVQLETRATLDEIRYCHWMSNKIVDTHENGRA